MIEELGGVTSQLVKLVLDAVALRHQVTANNLANVDTPGYVPRRVSFEEHLSRFAASRIDPGTDAFLSRELDGLRSFLDSGEAVKPTDEQQVELDREMVKLTENVLRYQALLEALSKRGKLVRMAINEGRQ